MTDIDTQLKDLSVDEKRALAARLLDRRLGGTKTVHPQSFGQQQWWYMQLMQPGTMALTVPLPMRIKSRVDAEAMRRAFQTVVDRHAALRTTYTMLAGEPMQEVHAHATVAFEQVDAAGWSDDDLRERVNAEHLRPFDLEHGPVLRVSLFSCSPTDHVLLPIFHHIAIDGLSLAVVLEELRQLYAAETSGLPNPLPPQTTQYTDFVVWQADLLGGPEGERLRNYWFEQLDGELPQLNLPTDRPRVPNQDFLPVRHEFPLDAELTAQLRELARQHRTTLFTVLLAACFVQLHRYNGEDDILVGSPVGGRTRPELENIVGCLNNIVIMRGRFSPGMTFSSFLEQMRQTVTDAIEHQDYPLSLIVTEMRARRSVKRDRLVDIAFNLQKLGQFGGFLQHLDPTAAQITSVAGLEVERFDLDQTEEGTDIFLNLLETDRTIIYRFRYNPDLFDRETIERMQSHIETLLRGIVADPEQEIGKLPLLTTAERRQLLVEWTGTTADFPRDSRIQDLFDDQAERTPDGIALISGSETISYAELQRRANQLANYLVRLGVKPETPVGVCLPRSVEMVVAVLAVLKAGGAYLPLDPNYPRERLAFMLRDAEVPIVLSVERLLEAFPAEGARVVRLDLDWPLIDAERVASPDVATTAESVAYLLYTSGSTGAPKGVEGCHRAALNRFAWMWQAFPFQPDEVCCLTTTLNFVDAVWELFGPLLGGVPLVLVPDDVLTDLGQLVTTLAEGGVSRLVLVPSLLDAILEHEPRLGERLPRLVLWTCSGEALSVDLLRRFRSASPSARLLNLYGSSEVAADVTWCDTGELGLDGLASVPIGRPIANTQVYILDTSLEPVPVGIPGELYIGGDNLARGYRNRPDLTAERFVSNPFSADPEARLFKTGDRGRYRADGLIEYVGRVDNQVKIRGSRVEPGEVEIVLAEHSDVHDAVVTAREDRVGEQRLVAYLVPTDGAELSVAELRAFLRDRLPEFMVPSVFTSLEAFPLTPNGKVDRRALPSPDVQGGNDEFAAPTTEMELLIAEVWREALDVARVGIYDNFFDLGGHSLLAIRTSARLLRRTGIRLNPGMLQTQTLGQIASMYSAMERQTRTEPPKPAGLGGQMLRAVRRFVGVKRNDSR